MTRARLFPWRHAAISAALTVVLIVALCPTLAAAKTAAAEPNALPVPWLSSMDYQLSDDGRYAVVQSRLDGLVPEDHNGSWDVFLHDRTTGSLTRISSGVDGQDSDGHSFSSYIGPMNRVVSDNGGVVVFHSMASNLVTDDTNDNWDVFVYHTASGLLERVSQPTGGGFGGGLAPTVSPDGRFVAFFSGQPLASPAGHVYVRDLLLGRTETVMRVGECYCFDLALSRDGHFLAYQQKLEGGREVGLLDRETGQQEVVSVRDEAAPAAEAAGGSTWVQGGVAISDDGRYVAFGHAYPLVPGEHGYHDHFGGSSTRRGAVYVRDRLLGRTELVSTPNERPSLSVCFVSACADVLEPTGLNPHDDWTSFGGAVDISPDGRFVTLAGGLVHDRLTATTIEAGGVSGDGRVTARSDGASLVVDDRGAALSVQVWDVADGGGGTFAITGRAQFREGAAVHADDGADSPDAQPHGGDLVGVSVRHRPETDDLVVRWTTTGLPWLGASSQDEPLQEVALVTAATHFEIEASAGQTRLIGRVRAAGPVPDEARQERLDVVPVHPYGVGVDPDPHAPYACAVVWGGCVGHRQLGPVAYRYEVLRCQPVCQVVGTTEGVYGVAHDTVQLVIPLDGVEPGVLTDIIARTSRQVGPLSETLDELSLPDLTVPAPTVEVGVAPAGTPPEEVNFNRPSVQPNGVYEGITPQAEGSDLLAWARACLGESCVLDAMVVPS